MVYHLEDRLDESNVFCLYDYRSLRQADQPVPDAAGAEDRLDVDAGGAAGQPLGGDVRDPGDVRRALLRLGLREFVQTPGR